MKQSAILLSLLFTLSVAGCGPKVASGVRIHVVMKRYSIDPPIIRVKSGEAVALDVTSTDVEHGLDIPALGIKDPVQPGRTTTISFTAPAKGEYRISCGVVCGPHHDDMKAELVVE